MPGHRIIRRSKLTKLKETRLWDQVKENARVVLKKVNWKALVSPRVDLINEILEHVSTSAE